MDAPERFQNIADDLIANNPDVSLGKMMSSPGIQYKGKNFAFFHKESMFFKLGKGYDVQAHGVGEVRYLSPFKTKAPLKAWYQVLEHESETWFELAEIALGNITKEIK